MVFVMGGTAHAEIEHAVVVNCCCLADNIVALSMSACIHLKEDRLSSTGVLGALTCCWLHNDSQVLCSIDNFSRHLACCRDKDFCVGNLQRDPVLSMLPNVRVVTCRCGL